MSYQYYSRLKILYEKSKRSLSNIKKELRSDKVKSFGAIKYSNEIIRAYKQNVDFYKKAMEEYRRKLQ